MHQEEPNGTGFAADFRVGGWLVEPSLGRLSRNGTETRLRPQLIDLLVVLAHHAGRTVSKDLILASVWQNQHVAESGMTRCIAEVRRALDDDAHESTFIQTIPKRGYRLVAPVEFLGAAAEGHVGGDAAPPPAPATHRAVEPPPAPVVASPVKPDDGPDAAIAAPVPLPRRMGWTLGWGLAGLLVMMLGWGVYGWSRPPVLVERDTVVLADFVNTTGDSAFDGTLRLATALHLGQAPFLHILSTDHVRSALTRMGRSPDQQVVGPVALELCRREGAAVLLAGSIAKLGINYAVGIEAIACRTGESVGRELREVDGKDRVLTAIESAATRLRQTLGESRASLLKYDVPIAQATTPSLEALKALSVGDFNRDNGRLADALTFYRRATDLDPQFAVAWARRGAAARNVGLSVGTGADGSEDEPTQAFRNAYALRERVSEPERFYILGHYYRFVANDPAKAVETYKMWKHVYPGSFVPSNNLASLYINTIGRYDDGLAESREAARLAPYSPAALSKVIAACMGTNQLQEAKALIRDAERRGIADLALRSLALEIALAEGDDLAIAQLARRAAGDRVATVVMTLYRAMAAASSGRLRESRQLWAEAARAAAETGPASRLADIRVAEAATEALLGDPRAAGTAIDAALAADPRPSTRLAAAIAATLSGDRDRAQRLLGQSETFLQGRTASDPVWDTVARALVDAGLGRYDRARETLRAAAPFERGRDYGFAPLGVRARIELWSGRPKEAAEAFREILRLRMSAPASPWVAVARLDLARALRDAGDLRASRAAFDSVVDAMKHADADAPLLVVARRERAALADR